MFGAHHEPGLNIDTGIPSAQFLVDRGLSIWQLEDTRARKAGLVAEGARVPPATVGRFSHQDWCIARI